LLTTREQAVGDFESFPVEQMDRTEGTLLLLRRAKLLTLAAPFEQATLLDRQIAEQIVKEQTLSVHRLVQVVLKDGLDEQSQHQYHINHGVEILSRWLRPSLQDTDSWGTLTSS